MIAAMRNHKKYRLKQKRIFHVLERLLEMFRRQCHLVERKILR